LAGRRLDQRRIALTDIDERNVQPTIGLAQGGEPDECGQQRQRHGQRRPEQRGLWQRCPELRAPLGRQDDVRCSGAEQQVVDDGRRDGERAGVEGGKG
jgi:hypothetical protein